MKVEVICEIMKLAYSTLMAEADEQEKCEEKKRMALFTKGTADLLWDAACFLHNGAKDEEEEKRLEEGLKQGLLCLHLGAHLDNMPES